MTVSVRHKGFRARLFAAACFALAAVGGTSTAIAQPRTAPSPEHSTDQLARAVFPVITAIKRSPAWQGALSNNAALRRLTDARRARITACQPQPACLVEQRLWTPDDLNAVATAVGQVSKRLTDIAVPPGDTIEAAVRRELGGINNVLRTYGLGTAPRYPKIDSALRPADSGSFRDSVVAALKLANKSRTSRETAFADSWRLALALLDINDRTEAVTFEPLDWSENAAAIRAAATTDWSKYRYTALIVPGAGPEDADTPLSPGGAARLTLAAERFRAGLAPFVIVSGGNVHPNRTRFNEAVEMRRALIDRFGIPAARIVIDPYARHTTTNLRNAVRRLAAMKAPLDKPALIVATRGAITYILSPKFMARNQEELGYQPGTLGTPLSDVEAPFVPSPRSLAIDPADPLDP